MATILRPNDLRIFAAADARTSAVAGPSVALAASVAAAFRHACEVLARLIDISLAAVVLLSDVVLAGSLGFMLAGQIAG
jgi:hypothetical protein